MTKPLTSPGKPKRKAGKRTAAMSGYVDRMMRPARRPGKPRVTKAA